LTSIIGTLINRLFFHYLSVQGELSPGLTPEIIQSKAWELGLKMNAAKQVISPDYFDFCQKRYFPDRRGGTYSIMRTLGRCIYQEGWLDQEEIAEKSGVPSDEFDMTSLLLLRIIVKLENCVNSPDHEWLVKFVRANEDHALDTTLALSVEQMRSEVRSRFEKSEGLWDFSTIAIIQWEEAIEGRLPVSEKHKRALVKKDELKMLSEKRKRERKEAAEREQEAQKTLKAQRKAENIRAQQAARDKKLAKKEAVAKKLADETAAREARKEANRAANQPKPKKAKVEQASRSFKKVTK
jgi:hypothetical protein